jgi:hypothetical protein
MSPLAELAAALTATNANPSLATAMAAPAGRSPAQEARFRANILTEQDLRTLVREEAQPIVEDLLMEGTVNLLVGDSGLGKTPLLSQLALNVATGTPFLNLETQQGPVLFCDAESAGAHFLSYIRSQKAFMSLEPDPGAIGYYLSNVRPHDEALVSDFEVLLAEKVALMAPKLVIIDCLRPFWPDAETKSEIAARVMRALRKIATEHRCAIVIVHHRRKSSREKGAERPDLETNWRDWLEEAAGTRTLINQTDTRLGIDLCKSAGSTYPEETYCIAGFSKFVGDVLPAYFTRVYDEDARPRGYTSATPGLNEEQARIFNLLPSPYSFKDVAELKGGKSRAAVANLCRLYTQAGIARSHGAGRKKHYRKEVDHVDATLR